MASPPPVITQLHRHAESLRASHLRTLFAEDVRRFSDLSREACGLFYDFSKEILDSSALQALLAWAKSEDLEQKIEALRLGEIVNKSEGQPALHMAWRAGADFVINHRIFDVQFIQLVPDCSS